MTLNIFKTVRKTEAGSVPSTVRRMCQGEVQQVLKVTPWTTTAAARGLLRSLSGSEQKKKKRHWNRPAKAHPSSSVQLPRHLATPWRMKGIHSAVGFCATAKSFGEWEIQNHQTNSCSIRNCFASTRHDGSMDQ